jgi:hypothetical protein
MDGFANAFWNLEQVMAWAGTRNPTAVLVAESGLTQSKVFPNLDGEPSSKSPIPHYLLNMAVIASDRKFTSGDEVNDDLWRRSGFLQPDQPTRIDYELSHGSSSNLLPNPWDHDYEEICEKLAGEGKVLRRKYFKFPLEKYLIHLISLDRLHCFATLPNENSRRKLRPEEIADHEIKMGPPHSRLIIAPYDDQSVSQDRTIVDAQFQRTEVITLFPELATQVAFSDLDLKEFIRNLMSRGENLSQKEVLIIARGHGFQQNRDKIIEEIKLLNPNQKPGPKGPRKNRAEMSA